MGDEKGERDFTTLIRKWLILYIIEG